MSEKHTPDPSPRAVARAAEAKERNANRPERPQVAITTTADRVCQVGPPHSDGRGWQETLLDAFGTTSQDFAGAEVTRLINSYRDAGAGACEQRDLNAGLAAIDGVRPESELEAMLASQMAATHALAMDLLGRTRRADVVPRFDSSGSMAVKLLRTFTMQIEALAKLKRGGEQTVRVEHVHVYPGAQAIVGTVSTRQAEGRGHDERGRQCGEPIDARALAFAPGAAVFGEDAGGDALPAAVREGQEAVQAPRRRGRDRRASR